VSRSCSRPGRSRFLCCLWGTPFPQGCGPGSRELRLLGKLHPGRAERLSLSRGRPALSARRSQSRPPPRCSQSRTFAVTCGSLQTFAKSVLSRETAVSGRDYLGKVHLLYADHGPALGNCLTTFLYKLRGGSWCVTSEQSLLKKNFNTLTKVCLKCHDSVGPVREWLNTW
jgi:hypothetical protein